MSDNIGFTPGAGALVATREVTYSGDPAAHAQVVGLVTLTGPDDAKTATDVSEANPMPVLLAPEQQTVTGAVRVGNSNARLVDFFGGASLDTVLWELVQTGAGMTVTTLNGVTTSYLRIQSGVTANAETIIRSRDIFQLPLRYSAFVSASQRIANQELFVELIQVDAAGVPITTATANTNAGTSPNHLALKFDGTSATSAIITVRGKGAPEAVSPGQVVQTTAATGTSPNFTPAGRVDILAVPGGTALLQKAVDSPAALTLQRMVDQMGPDPMKFYKLQIRARNLGTAPASSTDWRIHQIALFDFTQNEVQVTGGLGHSGAGSAVPVNITNALTAVQGAAGHGVGVQGNPFLQGLEGRNTLASAVANGQSVRAQATLAGATTTHPYVIPEQTWQFSGSLTTTTAVPARAAQGGAVRNYTTQMQLINTGAATVDLICLDGATEIWRLPLPVNVVVPLELSSSPLRGTAATALNFNLSAAGTVRVNAQGHSTY